MCQIRLGDLNYPICMEMVSYGCIGVNFAKCMNKIDRLVELKVSFIRISWQSWLLLNLE